MSPVSMFSTSISIHKVDSHSLNKVCTMKVKSHNCFNWLVSLLQCDSVEKLVLFPLTCTAL